MEVVVPDLSFQEKSVGGSLVAVAACSLYYFAAVSKMYAGGTIDPSRAAVLGISLVVALVLVEIVYHSIVAGVSDSVESDERDRRIETRASRNAYVVLSLGGFVLVVHLLGNALVDVPPRYRELVAPFTVANLLLLALVVAEIVKYVSQLVYYRRGL